MTQGAQAAGQGPRRRPLARVREGGAPVLFGAAIFGLASLALFIICQFWWSFGLAWGPLSATVLAFSLFALHVGLVSRRITALDPLVWIPVSFLMFQFGMSVAIEWIGYDGGGLGYDAWHFGVSPSLGRGYYTALLTMVAVIFGFYLAGVRDLSRGPDPTHRPDTSFAPTALVFTLASLLMTIFGIFLVGPSVAFGLYGDWWAAKDAGVDQRFLDIGVIFTSAGIFAVIASADRRQRALRGFAYLVALVIVAITVQKGDRSGLVALGIGAGWCYSQRVARIPWVPVLAAALFMIILLPVLAEWRSTRELDISREAGARALLGGSMWSMGSSVNAFIYTLDFLPSTRGYAWGYSYLAAFVNAIPNPLPTKGTTFRVTTLESSPSNWLSSIIAPDWYAAGGGYGYAMGAEWYYNFGMPGVLLGSMLLGYITSRVRNSSQASALGLVASALLFAAMTGLVRNAFGFSLKLATWPVAGLFLAHLAMRLLRRPPPRRLIHAEAARPLVEPPGPTRF